MDEIGPTDLGFRLDIKQILSEAQHRWLRPAEICEILRNYQQFHISPEAPSKPISGSVFLFDRKVLRYFRKDGHNWRKKKDGKTVKEAHEKLKVGSVDMLHCYYAHGEDNENFQRRSYWLLEEDLMHIVFVHYLEVKGNKTNTSFSGNTERVISNSETDSGISSSFRGTSPTSALSSAYEDAESDANFQASSEFHSFPRYPASPIADDSYSAQSSSYHLVPSSGGHGNGNFAGSTVVSRNQAVDSITWQLLGNHTAGEASYNQGPGPTYPVQSNLQLSSGGYSSNVHSRALNLPGGSKSTLFEEKPLPSNQVDELGSLLRQSEEGQLGNLKSLLLDANTGRSMNLDMGNSLMTLGNENLFLKKPVIGGFQADESLKKVDSFSRWMAKELGEDDELNMHSTSNGSTWSIMGNECDSNIPTQLQVDTDALNPSISQDQLFSISDFTPNWAYSGLELTVLITGTFLKSEQELSKYEFSVMFGEVEVPADFLANGILSCNAPVHRPGLVPFYITRSNRVACSEIREFEYKCEPDGNANYIDTSDDKVFAMHLYRRFEMILSLESIASPATAVRNDFEKQNVIKKITSLVEEENKYDATPILEKDGSLIKLAEQLLERKLKEKFYAWLLRITTEDGKGPRILDEWGQSVLHLAGALGFNWVFEPVIASGVSIDFRDVNGWTALHWAAFYGREETVAALISLGAAPGALTDPCVTYPLGRSPADLASFGGHKGISGFLAETTLTTQLSTLTVNDNGNAPVPEMQAVETISDRKAVSTNEEDVSDSLAAFRNAAQAAARIHEIFRLKSFRRKQVIEQSSDEISDEQCVSLVASKTSRLGAADRATNAAAVRIQKKFRGYKKRKEFLLIRQKVVKIQAHVRGHQVRKKYKPIIWTVGIVEKAILRWRRKRSGFRGFKPNEARTEPSSQGALPQEDDYDFLKDGRKQNEERMEKALERVKSMAQYPEARAQYRRLLNAAEGLREPKDDISDIIPDNFNDMNFPEEELLNVESLWDDDTFMSLTFQ